MIRTALLLAAFLTASVAAAQDWPRATPEESGLKQAVLDEMAVITSTNFNTRGMHDLTDQILAKYVIGAAR